MRSYDLKNPGPCSFGVLEACIIVGKYSLRQPVRPIQQIPSVLLAGSLHACGYLQQNDKHMTRVQQLRDQPTSRSMARTSDGVTPSRAKS